LDGSKRKESFSTNNAILIYKHLFQGATDLDLIFFSRKKDPDAAGKKSVLLLGLYLCFFGWGYEEDDIKETLRLFFFYRDGSFTKKLIKKPEQKIKN